MRNDLNETVVKLGLFSSNDKNKIDTLQVDYLSLISEITIANSKLNFIEEKISERLVAMQNNIDKVAITYEKLQSTIKNIIRSVINNKKNLASLTDKTIGSVGNNKSLKEELASIRAEVTWSKNEIKTINEKLKVLLLAYEEEAKYRKFLVWTYTRTKYIMKLVCKYTIKSMATRIVFYLFMIFELSPEALKTLEYIIRGIE